jgi:hypothetical protein
MDSDPQNGTFGVLAYNSRLICYSLELPWRDNRRSVSCIPEGVFPIFKRSNWSRAKQLGHTYEIIVPGRSAILFHPANLASELEGCVATGTSLGVLNGSRGVLNSTQAFNVLMRALWSVDHCQFVVSRILY